MAETVITYRERQCKGCAATFHYPVAKGSDRLYCTQACGQAARNAHWNSKPKPKCSVDGCAKPAANASCGLCHAHYGRQRRYGRVATALEANPPPPLLHHSNGYKLLYHPNHDLATKGQKSRVYEHRAVYYEHHGEGPFDCVHCGIEVSWQTMHVDHLDDDPANNSIGNLGASCPPCNKGRGQDKMKRKMRARATQITWQGQTKSVYEWAEQLGFSPTMLRDRIQAGWPLSRVMTEPRGRFGPKPRRI